MYYIVETDTSFDQASADLESAVKRHGLGVLHVHDLATTLRSKGIAFDSSARYLKSAIRSRLQKFCQPICA